MSITLSSVKHITGTMAATHDVFKQAPNEFIQMLLKGKDKRHSVLITDGSGVYCIVTTEHHLLLSFLSSR